MKILKRSIFPSQSRLGFTLIELMLVIAIISILSGVAYIGIQRAQVRVMNEKVTADLAAIENAMTQFAKDNNGLFPVPAVGEDKNLNCYHLDTSYAHDCVAADFMQAQIDNTLLTKRYLQEVPTDPRTGARYAYGVTRDGKYYQVAGIVEDQDGIFTARVAGSLHFTYPLKSLIRAYNGPNFVMDGEGYLPYSPDHRAITATLADITGTIKIDGKDVSNGYVLKAGSVISAASGSFVTLYFSDGSVTYLDGIDSPTGAVLRLLPHSAAIKNDEDGIITKIRLKLSSGKIWNKVVRLAEKSEFNVETTSAIAGVRGTEFGIDAAGTELIVLSGDVAARKKTLMETGTGPADYLDIDFVNAFTATQVATGDGAYFRKFYPPSAEEPMTTGYPLEVSEAEYLKSKYYRASYSNNLAPRLNEADAQKGILSLKLIAKSSNNPFSLPALTKIHAYEKGASMPLVSWISSEFTVKEPEGIVSINEAPAFFDGYMGKSVSFVYEDDRGNLTGHSQPHLLIQDNTYLTYAMLYGEWEEEAGTGGQQGGGQVPLIISVPSEPFYLADSHPFTSTETCDWQVISGGGVISALGYYTSLDDNLPQSQLITDIGTRFDTKNKEVVTVKCTNGSGSDQATFNVTYKPRVASANPPAGSGYRYSYYAGKVPWDMAKQTCEELKEGNLTWTLPGKGDNTGGMDIADGVMDNGKTSLQEIALTCENNGSQCTDTAVFGGAGAVWLKDESDISNAFVAFIANQSIANAAPKTTERAFRCVAE